MPFDRRRVYYEVGATDLRKVSKEGSSLSEMALVCGRFFAVGIMLSEDSSKLGKAGIEAAESAIRSSYLNSCWPMSPCERCFGYVFVEARLSGDNPYGRESTGEALGQGFAAAEFDHLRDSAIARRSQICGAPRKRG
jgi:hypothetical protein